MLDKGACHGSGIIGNFGAANSGRAARERETGRRMALMADSDEIVTVLLHAVAHRRAGGNGNRNRLDVRVIPYEREAYALLAAQLTPERVLALFAHRRAAKVTRYELPLLHAFNFVIDDVLEGGVNGSLNLDGHGKTNSYRLLSLPVEVPRRLVRTPR